MQHDFGPATFAVQQILRAWESVDWFVRSDDSTRAVELFHQHQARAHAFAPELFAERVELTLVRASWSEFEELCLRVQQPGHYDWKLGPLKRLALLHRQARAFDRAAQGPPLYIQYGGTAIWTLTPRLELRGHAPERAGWYHSYATADFIDAVEWQLAERTNDLSTNLFFPLALCYVAGVYPFALSATEVTLCSLA